MSKRIKDGNLERWRKSLADIEADLEQLKKQRRRKRAKESAPIGLSTPFAPIITKGSEYNRQIHDLEIRREEVKAIIRRLEEAETWE